VNATLRIEASRTRHAGARIDGERIVLVAYACTMVRR
jgi:hypothetical protein